MTEAQILKMFPNASRSLIEANLSTPPTKTPARGHSAQKKGVPWSDKRVDFQVDLCGPWISPDCAVIKFTIPLTPMGKPRMTQRDKWKKRPCVVRYRAWMDAARPYLPENLPQNPTGLSWKAYFPFPKSYSKKKRDILSNTLHKEKPDRDNIDKGICDFLFEQDKGIAFGSLEKFWDDGGGPRIEIIVHP